MNTEKSGSFLYIQLYYDKDFQSGNGYQIEFLVDSTIGKHIKTNLYDFFFVITGDDPRPFRTEVSEVYKLRELKGPDV